MLRPFLTALNEEKKDGSGSKNEEERIRSIKEHFDALTAMTPNDFTGEQASSANAEQLNGNYFEDLNTKHLNGCTHCSNVSTCVLFNAR